MGTEKLPITCPLCGRKNEFAVDRLKEGEKITCSLCHVTLTLHGHMLQEIQEEIARSKRD